MSNVIQRNNNTMVFHPGYYVEELRDSLGITQSELAKRLGVTPKLISTVLSGKATLSKDLASRLSKMTGTSFDLWMNLQNKYDKAMAEMEEESTFLDEKKILDHVDGKYLQNIWSGYGKLSSFEKVRWFRNLMKVHNLNSLKSVDMFVSFRSGAGEFEEKNIVNSNVMVQLAINVAQEIPTEPYDRKKLLALSKKIPAMTRMSPQEFMPVLKEEFSQCGVAFVLLPSLKNAKINGAVKKLDDKVVLMLNDRNKRADIFWFSLLHEIGHIVNGDYEVCFSNENGQPKSEREKNADKFSRDILINTKDYQKFLEKGAFSAQSVIEFAARTNIDPGIVVGRLQNERKIPFSSLNHLKSQYQIG